MGNVVASICYRSSDQEKVIRPSSDNWRKPYVHISWASWGHHICWRNRTTGHKHSSNFLECIDDNILTRTHLEKGALLDLMLKRKKELLVDVKVRDSFGCSDYQMVGFGSRSLEEGIKQKRKITSLGFRGADFHLFRYLFGKILCDMVLKRRGVEECWLNHA